MNQKYPIAPEKEPANRQKHTETQTAKDKPICVGRIDDIPETPQMRRRPESLVEEERHAGISTVVFSVTIAAVALFVCLLVAVLTVRTALPSHESGKTDGDKAGTTEPTPSGDMGAVIFTPGTAVLPKSNGNIASISGIDSSYAVLVDAETGEILAGKNADAQFSPASMTKVMTLIVACEKLKTGELNKVVYMTDTMREYVTTGNYKDLEIYGFKAGQGARIEDLLYGIGVISAADCVMMVASYICPAATPAESEAAFVALMNAEAQAMGLTSTHFDNAVGYESDGNKSTATEIAAIMMRALGCEKIKAILSVKDMAFTTYVEGGQPKSPCYFVSTLFRSANETRSRQYAYEQAYGKFKLSNLTLSGGKTGTLGEKKTGFSYSLVSFATGGGKTYIVVTGETGTGANVLKDAKTIYDGYAR